MFHTHRFYSILFVTSSFYVHFPLTVPLPPSSVGLRIHGTPSPRFAIWLHGAVLGTSKGCYL